MISARSPRGDFPIPDAKRRLPHWRDETATQFESFSPIPDAKRRLPHWRDMVKGGIDAGLGDSRRQKASASLEGHRPRPDGRADGAFQTPKGVCLIGGNVGLTSLKSARPFQTPKGVCLIGGSETIPEGRKLSPRGQGLREIPDAKRRLPHWRGLTDGGARTHVSFQTPKGVCLIGGYCLWQPNLEVRIIPDAKRRLPHWRPLSSFRSEFRLRGFQTPKGVCLIGGRACRPARTGTDSFQTPKGVCLIGGAITRATFA